MLGEAPRITKKEVKKLIIWPAIGGAVLGFVGYYTIGPGYAELQDSQPKTRNEQSANFNQQIVNPFDAIETK